MGTYLATGVVQKMQIRKKDMESKKFLIENIVKSLQKELNVDHYVFGEDEDVIFWKIKPQMLEENFVEFLETQFKMYDESNIHQDTIAKIKEAQKGEKIIELAKSVTLVDFQMADNILEPLKVLGQNGFLDYITVNYYLMAFFIDGKIIMECYGNILHYFEKNIRLQEEKYPVVTCLKTMITS